jgi:hypothetical protein
LFMGFSNRSLFGTFPPWSYMKLTLDVINVVVENYRETVSGSIIFFQQVFPFNSSIAICCLVLLIYNLFKANKFKTESRLYTVTCWQPL